jgi:hypothetical protein
VLFRSPQNPKTPVYEFDFKNNQLNY